MEGEKIKNTFLDVGRILERAGVTEKSVVADLGCGATGRFVFACAQAVGKNGRVYAIDILKDVLNSVARKAKEEQLKNIFPVWSNLEIFRATKIESGGLEVALLINTLFQSKKRGKCCVKRYAC